MRSRLDRTQSGVSLIEVLVALFLISVLVIALVNGLLTSTKATTVSNRTQRTGAALTSFGETLKQIDYYPCADPLAYQRAYEDLLAQSPGEDFGTGDMDTVTVDKVQYWMPGSYKADEPVKLGEYIDTCEFPEGGSQLLTLTVTMGPDTKTGQIVKRDPYAAGFIAATTTTAPPPASQAPVAVIAADKTQGPSQLTVQFNSDGSSDPNGVLTAFEWNFGDGVTSVEPNPTHVFNNPGKFKVTLTVTDSEAPPLTATDRITIQVTGKPPVPSGLHKTGSGMLGLLVGYLDLEWNAVPGAENYQIQTNGLGCSITQDAGSSNKVRITSDTWCSIVALFDMDARIRVRVGPEWSDWSSWVNVKW